MKKLLLLIIFLGCAKAEMDMLDPTSALGVILNLSLIRPEYCRSYPLLANTTYISNTNGTNVTLTYNVWDTSGRPISGIYQVPGCNPASISVSIDPSTNFFSSNIIFAGGGGSCSATRISVKTTNQFDSNFFLSKKVQIISNNGTPFNTTQSLYETKMSETICYR